MEKVQWNSIDIKQNGLKYSKNDKSSTLPRCVKWTVNNKNDYESCGRSPFKKYFKE